MKTNKELAEIARNRAAQLKSHVFRPWSMLNQMEQETLAEAMQAAIDALLASVPLDVTVEQIEEIHLRHHILPGPACIAILNLCRASMAKATASLEAKYQQELARAQKAEGDLFMLRDSLSAVMSLPEKWKAIWGNAFIAATDLEQALSTLSQPSAEVVEPVPETQKETTFKDAVRSSHVDRWAVEKAAHAKGIKIQYRNDPAYRGLPTEWTDCQTPSWGTGYEYRIDPSGHLSREHLMKLCGGQEPHRWDWKLEDLPEGMRPLYLEEPWIAGDEIYRSHFKRWEVAIGGTGDILNEPTTRQTMHCRTRRPAPQNHAQGGSRQEIEGLKDDVRQAEQAFEVANQRAEAAEAKCKEMEGQLEQALKVSGIGLCIIGALGMDASTTVEQAVEKIAALESRIAALTPRPVSVRPTKEDGDREGDILVFTKTEGMHTALIAPRQWDEEFYTPADLSWLPGNLAAYGLAETPEDKERREFEAWALAQWPHSKMERTPTGYSHESFDQLWKGWQARAGKEAA